MLPARRPLAPLSKADANIATASYIHVYRNLTLLYPAPGYLSPSDYGIRPKTRTLVKTRDPD
jgi:hypothetical protein